MVYEFTVNEDSDGKRLRDFLRKECMLSSSLIRSIKYTDDGLLVDGIKAKTDKFLCEGQIVTIKVPAKTNSLPSCEIKVPVFYESESVLVFDKPAGLATHPSLNDPNNTLANVYATLLRERGEEDAFRPVNRLDKNTSGLVLAAKDRYAAPLVAKTSAKQYFAICEGIVEDEGGTIDAPIARESESIIKRKVQADGSPSTTEYEVLERIGGHTVLKITPYTGRTHQIRVHMAHIGHPLAGDTLYGGRRDLIDRHALHCAFLTFTEPRSGKIIELKSPLPADMEKLINILRKR